MSRPKPQRIHVGLMEGLEAEFEHYRCGGRPGWAAHITLAELRPGVSPLDQSLMSDIYPDMRTARAAVMSGTARFRTYAERHGS